MYETPVIEEVTYAGHKEVKKIDIEKYKIEGCKPGACVCIGRCY